MESLIVKPSWSSQLWPFALALGFGLGSGAALANYHALTPTPHSSPVEQAAPGAPIDPDERDPELALMAEEGEEGDGDEKFGQDHEAEKEASAADTPVEGDDDDLLPERPLPHASEHLEGEPIVQVTGGTLDAETLTQALNALYKDNKTVRTFARQFYKRHEPGLFVHDGALNALGQMVFETAKNIASEAIDPAPYRPIPERGQAAEIEALAFDSFLNLALDYRFVRSAGPFLLRRRATVFDRERRELNRALDRALEAPNAKGTLAKLRPPHPDYLPMLKAYAHYSALVEAGPCPQLPKGWRFGRNSKGSAVETLQRRLQCEGYYDGEIDGIYDGPTTQAVIAYQLHHDMEPDGIIGSGTINSMNVPLTRRRDQIALSLQRMREAYHGAMEDFFIRVNIPSFHLQVYDSGVKVREQKTIVGSNRLDDDKVRLVQGHLNRTKLFETHLYQITVNPTWILPKRIEEGEVVTSLAKDEDYLEKSNIKRITLSSGKEVLIQGSGDGNVLGKIKFLLEGTNAIYLHDTNRPDMFQHSQRDFSHGCMRVQGAVDFATWLLERDGFSEDEIARALSARSTQRGFTLKNPIKLVTEYMTVGISDTGGPIFYTDIYRYDRDYWNGKLPPVEQVRWGSPTLRPRWVPLVDKATVDGWKKEGKRAPHNLGEAKNSGLDSGP